MNGAYTRKEIELTHKDYKENVNQWEYFIRSFISSDKSDIIMQINLPSAFSIPKFKAPPKPID